MLAGYLEQSEGELFLGDNGGRPAMYGDPHHFWEARRCGIRILPGGDPLPMATATARRGSYGFSFEGSIDPEAPCRSLKSQIRRGDFSPRPFGNGEQTLRFAQNQLLMQLRVHQVHLAEIGRSGIALDARAMLYRLTEVRVPLDA